MVAMITATAEAKDRPKLKCAEECSLDYAPVCGAPPGTAASATAKENHNMKSFGNECVMRKHNCEKSESKWL